MYTCISTTTQNDQIRCAYVQHGSGATHSPQFRSTGLKQQIQRFSYPHCITPSHCSSKSSVLQREHLLQNTYRCNIINADISMATTIVAPSYRTNRAQLNKNELKPRMRPRVVIIPLCVFFLLVRTDKETVST